MKDIVNKYFENRKTPLNPGQVRSALIFLKNFHGDKIKIKKHIDENSKKRQISEQVFTGGSQHIEAVSYYFKNIPYKREEDRLFYSGPLSFPEDLYLVGYADFARDLVQGIIVLLRGEIPEICLKKFELKRRGLRATPYQTLTCNFDIKSNIYFLNKKTNIGCRMYMKAIKDLSLARVLVELKKKEWISFRKILEIIVEDVRKLISIEDRGSVNIVLNGNTTSLRDTNLFFEGLRLANKIEEGLAHIGKENGSANRFNLNKAFDYVRQVICTWVKYKHNIDPENFLIFQQKEKLKDFFSFYDESIEENSQLILEATILGNEEDLKALSRVFCSMCKYDPKNKVIFYKPEPLFGYSFLKIKDKEDFFNEECNILEGTMKLLSEHIFSIPKMRFYFKDFLFKDQNQSIVSKGELVEKNNPFSRFRMSVMKHISSSGDGIYKMIRKNDDLLKVIKLFSRGWSWDNFSNICEIIKKNNPILDGKSVDWIGKRSNNSTILYDGGRHMKSNQSPESPCELGKAFDIISKETIKWIKLKFGIDVQVAENNTIEMMFPEENREHIKIMSHTEHHETYSTNNDELT